MKLIVLVRFHVAELLGELEGALDLGEGAASHIQKAAELPGSLPCASLRDVQRHAVARSEQLIRQRVVLGTRKPKRRAGAFDREPLGVLPGK